MESITCLGCKEYLNRDAYGVDRSKKNGLNSLCRACATSRSNKWKKDNREKVNLRRRENRSSQRESNKRYRDRNREKYRKYCRERYRRNPEEYKKSRDKWAASNPKFDWEKAKRRRARRYGAYVEEVTLDGLKERSNGLCYLCGKPIDFTLKYPDKYSKSIDHVQALINGGEHSYKNCELTHLTCNLSKGSKEVSSTVRDNTNSDAVVAIRDDRC